MDWAITMRATGSSTSNRNRPSSRLPIMHHTIRTNGALSVHTDSAGVVQGIDRTVRCGLRGSHHRGTVVYRSFVGLFVFECFNPECWYLGASTLDMIQDLAHKLREEALIVDHRIIFAFLFVVECLFAYISLLPERGVVLLHVNWASACIRSASAPHPSAKPAPWCCTAVWCGIW